MVPICRSLNTTPKYLAAFTIDNSSGDAASYFYESLLRFTMASIVISSCSDIITVWFRAIFRSIYSIGVPSTTNLSSLKFTLVIGGPSRY